MVFLILTIVAVSLVTIVNFVVFKSNVDNNDKSDIDQPEEYSYHFAMIYDNKRSDKLEKIYESANMFAKTQNAYVEIIGKDLPENYSKNALMDIAIMSGVDGIILEGDDNVLLPEMINKAYENGIPVVTFMTDVENSQRSSFVGIGAYDVGFEFGREVNKINNRSNANNILVLMSDSEGYYEQHTMYQSIIEALSDVDNINIETKLIDSNNDFSSDEAIRDILLDMEKEPDIMICLSEKITESAYQQVVEYNKVGSIDIMGIAASDMVINAVKKQLVDYLISFNKETMGIYCIEALMEYINTGYVSEYYMVDTTLITPDNVEGGVADE